MSDSGNAHARSTWSDFWRSPLTAAVCGGVASLAMAGLSSFAMRRLGQEMNWTAVLTGGAAGGLAGHGVLRLLLAWLKRSSTPRSSMDRFVWLVIAGFVTSLVMGALAFFLIFLTLPASDAQGVRALGAKVFIVIGWLVGILAASLPLAILELNEG